MNPGKGLGRRLTTAAFSLLLSFAGAVVLTNGSSANVLRAEAIVDD
jgi:hypothetical protein